MINKSFHGYFCPPVQIIRFIGNATHCCIASTPHLSWMVVPWQAPDRRLPVPRLILHRGHHRPARAGGGGLLVVRPVLTATALVKPSRTVRVVAPKINIVMPICTYMRLKCQAFQLNH